MALLNPVYALLVPFLFVVTIPLAILAGITTTLAFSVLMCRVAVVYLDIAVNMVPQYVTGRRVYPLPGRFLSSLLSAALGNRFSSNDNVPPPNSSPSESRSASGQSTPSHTHHATTNRKPTTVRHHRRRRTSGASFSSVGSITPIDDATNTGLSSSKRNSSYMMIPSIGIDRDFEGVGGWRLSDKHGDADDDAWAQLNSRLELPVDQQRRQHRRSHSGSAGGATTPGGGDYLVMKSPRAVRSKEGSPETAAGRRGRGAGPAVSPNCSRQRTPTNGMPPPLTTIDSSGSYFPPMISSKATRRVVI